MIMHDSLKFSFIWNFHNKKCVVFNLTSFYVFEYDCVIKAREIINFLPLLNNSFTVLLSFHYFVYQPSYHQKQLKFFVFYLDCILQVVEYSIKGFESFIHFKPVLSRLLIKNLYFASYGSLAYKLYQYLVHELLD